MRRTTAWLLLLTAATVVAGCMNAGDPATNQTYISASFRVGKVTLPDGRVVVCVDSHGTTCDWAGAK